MKPQPRGIRPLAQIPQILDSLAERVVFELTRNFCSDQKVADSMSNSLTKARFQGALRDWFPFPGRGLWNRGASARPAQGLDVPS
jgi:hypothetical protein